MTYTFVCRGIAGGGNGSGDEPQISGKSQYTRVDKEAKIIMQFWGGLCCGAFSRHLQSTIVPGVRGYGWSWLTAMLNKVLLLR